MNGRWNFFDVRECVACDGYRFVVDEFGLTNFLNFLIFNFNPVTEEIEISILNELSPINCMFKDRLTIPDSKVNSAFP